MNILNFNKWSGAVNEGFDAKIENDEDNKDEIEIEAPNEDNNIKYTVTGDSKVKSIKQVSIVDKDGQQKNIKNKIEIVKDEKLKDDIIKASHSINKIKDRIRANELERLTGGDDTPITREIMKIIDTKANDDVETPSILYNTLNDANVINTPGNKLILKLSNIQSKYKIQKTRIYKNFKEGTIGKGEYLLPLLFSDVYKERVYYKDAKGDNYILHDNIKYFLELKGSGAEFSFNKEKIDLDNISEVVIEALMIYIKNQQRNNRSQLFLCFFHEKEQKPESICFINVSNIKENRDVIRKTFKTLVKIDTENVINKNLLTGKFKCSFDGKYIICKLSQKKNESSILSRDNFVNKIYTK